MISEFGVNIAETTLDAVAPAHRQETHSVDRVIGRFVTAWNKHDPAQMASIWAEDGDLITPWGQLARGRDQVLELFAQDQRGMMKSSTHQLTIASVRWAADDVVIVDADCTLTGILGPDGRELAAFKPHVLFVLGKSKGEWSVLSARPYEYCARPGSNK